LSTSSDIDPEVVRKVWRYQWGNQNPYKIITPMTKFQIYVYVLVLFSYMIFWILMTLNNIVSFLNVEPKTARPAIFWLQILIYELALNGSND
jgi:hypothetical protein